MGRVSLRVSWKKRGGQGSSVLRTKSLKGRVSGKKKGGSVWEGCENVLRSG